jgi:UDP-N-acetylmuramate-alanine ligase
VVQKRTKDKKKRFYLLNKKFTNYKPSKIDPNAIASFQIVDVLLNHAGKKVYAASEAAIAGVSSISIANKMSKDKTKFEPSMIDVVSAAVETAGPGDVIITLGAGDVNLLVPLILQTLEEQIAD